MATIITIFTISLVYKSKIIRAYRYVNAELIFHRVNLQNFRVANGEKFLLWLKLH